MRVLHAGLRMAGWLIAGAALTWSVAWGLEIRFAMDVDRRISTIRETGAIADRPWPVPAAFWPPGVQTFPAASPARRLVDVERLCVGMREIRYTSSIYGPLVCVETRVGWPAASHVRYRMDAWTGTGLRPRGFWYAGWHAQNVMVRRDLKYKRELWLPVQPLWTGLAANSLVYGSVLATATWGVRHIKRRNRRRSGSCEACGYPLGVAAVCTECGRTRE